MMYNVCDRHPLVCVSRLMVALQLYIIQQRVSLVCAKFRICSFIVIKINFYFFLDFSNKFFVHYFLLSPHIICL